MSSKTLIKSFFFLPLFFLSISSFSFNVKADQNIFETSVKEYFRAVADAQDVNLLKDKMDDQLKLADDKDSSYYDEKALLTAKEAIRTYFNASSNEARVQAKKAVKLAMDAVRNPQDQKIIYVFYQYYVALDTIEQYEAHPTQGYLFSARKNLGLVHLLNQKTAVKNMNNVRLEDELLDRLAGVFDTQYGKTYDLSTLGNDSVSGSAGFGSSAVLYCDGQSLFVSVPDKNNQSGVIYYFQKQQGGNAWVLVNKIQPVNPVEADHFGRTFVVGYDTFYQTDVLIASSEPSNGQAALYIFTRQKDAWIQQNKIELTRTSAREVYDISLAFSNSTLIYGNNNSLVVGFSTRPQGAGGYGKYLILEHSDYKIASEGVASTDIWDIAVMGAVNDSIEEIQSVAIKGDYAAIGYRSRNSRGQAGSYILLYERAVNAEGYGWMLIKEEDVTALNTGSVNAMPLVFHYKPDAAKPVPVTLLIGCPNFLNSSHEPQGAVFEMSKMADPDNNTQWSSPVPLNLQMFTQEHSYAPKHIGYKMVLDEDTLAVATQSRLHRTEEGSFYSAYVYQLSDKNRGQGLNIDWQYLLAPDHQLSLAVDKPDVIAVSRRSVGIIAVSPNQHKEIHVISPAAETLNQGK